ncbi:DUF4238 domain-containing protein [Cryomorpha ignava]|uniref:DUF4238 domain-containing protein n=1 Tax=Cryomorpha ignava TaxID=101383 RepID=A0A7K3WSF9_9FLAO|nr:DUF4238 domain-containing protein [Cryomorpha ignava]NEN24630.1 DUF4238 domain-containing protein [Cryomorpha ignava]
METDEFKFPSDKKSSRHHYIPKFLLNGFTNSDGKLFVFDKLKNRVLNKPVSPKWIFFERDRNTIEINQILESSIIEDLLFSNVDNLTSKVVRYYQQEAIEKLDFNSKNTAEFEFFLINLFWRTPMTDHAAGDIMDRSVIKTKGIDPEKIRNDPAYRKIYRAALFKHHIDEIIKSGKNINKLITIHQSSNEIYLIGDNPILFRRTPHLFSEFAEIDYLIAVSSQRLYSHTCRSLKNTLNNPRAYNASVIDQSERYVACADRDFLKECVQIHDEVTKDGLNSSVKELAFQNDL